MPWIFVILTSLYFLEAEFFFSFCLFDYLHHLQKSKRLCIFMHLFNLSFSCVIFFFLPCAPSLRHSAVLTDLPFLEIKNHLIHITLETAVEANNTLSHRLCFFLTIMSSRDCQRNPPPAFFKFRPRNHISAPRSCPPSRSEEKRQRFTAAAAASEDEESYEMI